MQVSLKQFSQLKRWVAELDIEFEAKGVTQHHAQQAIDQVPYIARPDLAAAKPSTKLAENGFDAIAEMGQQAAACGMGITLLVLVGRQQLEGRLAMAQVFLELGRTIVAVAQGEAGLAVQQLGRYGHIRLVRRSYGEACDQAGPGHVQVQAQTPKGLPRHMVIAVSGTQLLAVLVAEAVTKGGTRKAAHGQRQGINETKVAPLGHDLEPVLPEALFEVAQIGGLAREGGAVQFGQSRKEVRIVAAEISVDGAVALQAQIGADDFHAQDFAVVQRRLGATLPQAACGQLSHQSVHCVIHLAKARYNQVVQVHDLLLKVWSLPGKYYGLGR